MRKKKKTIEDFMVKYDSSPYSIKIISSSGSQVYMSSFCSRQRLIDEMYWIETFIDKDYKWNVHCDSIQVEELLSLENYLRTKKEIQETQTSLLWTTLHLAR